LISILLPALNKAREGANRAKCASNLRQLGAAVMMYVNDNRGFFPRTAPRGPLEPQREEDWLHWQQSRSVEGSALRKSLGETFNRDVFMCPSDDVPSHDNGVYNPPDGIYQYSYVMLDRLGVLPPSYLPQNKVEPAQRLSRVRNSSAKIMLVEEDARTLDDGNWYPVPSSPPYQTNLLSNRHDRSSLREADVVTSTNKIPNAHTRGNAGFCDGHVDYVPRSQAHHVTVYDWTK
jgi:prepilin-type processing-associated H-X9-DG protein